MSSVLELFTSQYRVASGPATKAKPIRGGVGTSKLSSNGGSGGWSSTLWYSSLTRGQKEPSVAVASMTGPLNWTPKETSATGGTAKSTMCSSGEVKKPAFGTANECS